MEQYNKDIREIEKKYKEELHIIRTQFVERNKEFNIGDFIGNVTGIIKVERISYRIFYDTIDVEYHGYRYKKHHGELLRTKDNKMSSLTYSLKKIQ